MLSNIAEMSSFDFLILVENENTISFKHQNLFIKRDSNKI